MGDAVAVACASAVNRMTLTHSMFTYPMPDTSSYCIVWDVCIPLEDVTIEQKAEVGQAWRWVGATPRAGGEEQPTRRAAARE